MQLHLSGKTLDEIAIERLQFHEPLDGYWLAFSGGKDSCVILDLAKRAGVKFEAHYSLTTVDPPELVWFIRQEHPEVIVDRPKQTMWQVIRKENILPTSTKRFCCRTQKESNPEAVGRVTVTGIRAKESHRRSKRQCVEPCQSRGGHFVHAIFDWSTSDVWSYIKQRGLAYCKLYDEGFSRIGCVCCPKKSARLMQQDISRFPRLAAKWRRMCDEVWAANPQRHDYHPTADAMWQWWINRARKSKIQNDVTLFD